MNNFVVNNLLSLENFAKNWNNTQPDLSKACPPCIVVIVGIVVGGAYCAWKQQTANTTCLSAYQSCVTQHGSCSFLFQSSTCGGSCTVNPL